MRRRPPGSWFDRSTYTTVTMIGAAILALSLVVLY
jgi:hypothetical protein